MEEAPQFLRIREAFRAAWQSGSRPNIIELIGDLEEPARAAALRELISLDVAHRRRLGESPRASEYIAQFPESRDIVEPLFSETHSLVGQSPPETLVRPLGQPLNPDRSMEAARASMGGKEDRDRIAPIQSPSPTDVPSKPIVPLQEFVRSLTDSGLMDPDELDAFISSLPAEHRPENGKQLAQELHRCKRLTRFQVQAVYQGKTRGLVVGNYVVLDKLGEGGMGQVYKARHRRMDRVVALKVLPAAATKSPDSVKRFLREVKAAAKLAHPHIVTAHDADEHRGVHFLVMEYVEGKDLARFVREKGPLPVKQAVDCIMQAAQGLAHAHKQGIIHRDIKPHNLLLDKSGTVKILDMGLARLDEQMHKQADDDGLTRSGAVMGTLDYMSPEQAMDTKTADARADIYSLGCTLHFLLTGRPPYSGDSLAAKIVAHRVQPIPSLRAKRKDVPEALDQVFTRMLAKAADERQASMEALLRELEQCRLAMEACAVPDVGLPVAAREEPLELSDDETTPLIDPVASSVDMTQRWVAPSVGPPTESRSWLRKYKPLLIGLGLVVPASLILVLTIMVTLRTTTVKPETQKTSEATPKPDSSKPSTTASPSTGSDDSWKFSTVAPPPAIAPFDAAKAKEHQEAWANYSAAPVQIENSLGMKLVLIPAGVFKMGSPPNETDQHEDEFQHQVRITKPFYFGVHEVTQAEYTRLMGTNPSFFAVTGGGRDRVQGQDSSRFPVETASWEDATEFCRKLSASSEEQRAGRVYRLPTEAEWEYACRAGATTEYCFGNDASRLGKYAWLEQNASTTTHLVGQKQPNAWGLHDMHGNVREWCQDWYDSDYYQHSPTDDPQGPPTASSRVIRGGGWDKYVGDCRAAFRLGYAPSFRYNGLGFRVALVLLGK